MKTPTVLSALALAALLPVANAHAGSCKGNVMRPPSGLKEVSDYGLKANAIGATDAGKLCDAKVFETQRSGVVKVWRVWNSAKSYTKFGGWWSFDRPSGPVSKYREKNAICPEWSDLDQLSVCTLKKGARVAVGPGQSAKCAKGTYPKSAVNQVFIPNDGRNNKIYVENCKDYGRWP